MTQKNPGRGSRREKVEGKDRPKDGAAGVTGVYYSMKPAIEHMGLNRTWKTLLAMNQKDGLPAQLCLTRYRPPQGLRVLRERHAGTWEATPVGYLLQTSRDAPLNLWYLGHLATEIPDPPGARP